MIEAIMVVAMPFIVKALTGAIKNIGSLPWMDYRVTIIRAVVAVLSLIGAVLTVMVDGGVVGQPVIEGAVLAVFNAAVATWLYVRAR